MVSIRMFDKKRCPMCGCECHCEVGPCMQPKKDDKGNEHSCGCGVCYCNMKTDWG